jgi:serine/threonine protein phosphatase PrpC
MKLETVARSHVGCRRKVNEDSVLARPDLGLWAVADGMGGHAAGDVASALVVEGLATTAPGLTLSERTNAARRQLTDANARLLAMGKNGPEGKTIGTTAVALLLDREGFACLWVGDSRIYRARRGALRQLTRDHSLVQQLVDLGEISAAEARDHPNANVITRAVGSADRLEIDSVEGDTQAGDAFLLASDGLTRLAQDQEMLDCLEAERLEDSADRLLDLCLERGAPDNVSFVLVRVSQPA